ncbi:MAG: OmpA family protein [Cryomorphaceae bacterium]
MAHNFQPVRQMLMTVCVLFCSWASAQEVTVINNFPEERAVNKPEDYVLKRVTQHTYIVNEYEPSQASQRAKVMQLISYSLRSYVDNQYFSTRNKVTGLEKGNDFNDAASAMVRNALWIHDLEFHDKFKGFSGDVTGQAQKLFEVSDYSLNSPKGSGVDRRKETVELYSFQRMVYGLKVTMEHEISAFLDRFFKYDDDEPVELLPLPESDAPMLSPLDITLDPLPDLDSAFEGLKPALPEVASTGKPLSRRERRRLERQQPAFGAEMVELLRENNKILANYGNRFEDMQSQIDAEREQRSEGLETVREEVKALRELIKATLTGGSNPGVGIPAAAAPAVEIIFDRNAYELAPGHRALLNRAELMLRNAPNARAVITGFADRTGSADYNAWISEQRAKAVHDYFVEKGVSPSRLTVTYVGDAASSSPNPADRKVEVRVE